MFWTGRTLCRCIRRTREPVLVGHGLCCYRYLLSGQENWLRPTDIRVSGITSLPWVGAWWGNCGHRLKRAYYLSEDFVSSFGRHLAGYSRNSCSIVSETFFVATGKRFISTTNMPESKPFERLPKCVVPKHYDLILKPDLKTLVFEGKETIEVEVKTVTDKIVLNSLDLTIKSVEYTTSTGNSIVPTDVSLSVEDETLTLTFPEPLHAGNGLLAFDFTGEINDKMKGFYRSKYVSPDGEERYAGVTQFEATDARRCFPCWDEPAIKATFNITLVVPESKVALSNMPVVSETNDPSNPALRVVKFDTTPIMSTYLVAVVVGEYDFVEDKSNDGVLVRVYTPVGKKEQGRFALEVATKVLPYYKDYFQIAYPLPKIDLIAIADFSAGAMENWGLVTYRETCLLVDPENTSAVRKQWIALVVGHELAHQWFGNLVTMEWWTHLWLNEGYASFVEFLCVAHLFPEYDIWTQFVTDTYIRALELDCLKNSHPIEVPVGHPSEIDEIFDDISYNKGASVIRMLHKYIGDEDFRKGMNIYLTRHQYKNTFTEDLWAALEEASNKPVAAVMSTWTKQMGFPVVKVLSKQSGPTTRTLTLTQEKFCADGSTSECNGCLWMVPIMLSTSRNPHDVAFSTVLDTRSANITLQNVSASDWVKVNPGTVGYYRTQYPPDMLELFVPAIQNKSLPPLDRLGLLDDLFAMVQAGQTPTIEVLKLMEAFSDEDNYTVWSSISNCLSKLSILLSHTDYEDLFKAYGRKLMARVGQRLGWDPKENESHLDTLLRSLVIGRLGWFGEKSVIEEAKKRFDHHCNGKCHLPADLRSPVYKAVLSVGDEDTYNTMLKLYREADLHEEKDRISRALGAIGNEAILKKVLDFAMSEEVRSQDTVFVIISVAMTKVGRELAWNFFKENWQELMNRYEGGFLLARLVKYTTENFASEEQATEVENFFREHHSPGTERTVQQSCETIRLNAAWLARDSESTRKYLIETQTHSS
ncbi:puromycin-sensitive aminopeptidase isoform X2 [Schistocerca nitens]|uniref:puromycin-sensitive aminopeptidase isoform X2 n=1 Tax=Schistocerca nitens TaxID=7011 RepID=UPI00211890F3|nr:puromycin-sensitive aminopeptidase isoform X2 [Schistocerca nitens]